MPPKKTLKQFLRFLVGVRVVDEETAEALKGSWRWEILGPVEDKREEKEQEEAKEEAEK